VYYWDKCYPEISVKHEFDPKETIRWLKIKAKIKTRRRKKVRIRTRKKGSE
jgi:hypothetical protein